MRQRLYGLATSQAGYFTAARAIGIGYTYQSQKCHVDLGNWLRVDRGIFRIRERPVNSNDGFTRWVLWSKHRGVISHDSAAEIHQIGLFNPARVHLAVPTDFRMSSPRSNLHYRNLPKHAITTIDGAPTTTVLQTVVDIIEYHIDEEQIDAVGYDALDSGRISRTQITAKLEELDEDSQNRGHRVFQGFAI